MLVLLNLPEARPFVIVATHLPPTVIPGTFHSLKWLLLKLNIGQYWWDMGTCRGNRGTQVCGMRFGFI